MVHEEGASKTNRKDAPTARETNRSADRTEGEQPESTLSWSADLQVRFGREQVG
jgi:hypothetical protein